MPLRDHATRLPNVFAAEAPAGLAAGASCGLLAGLATGDGRVNSITKCRRLDIVARSTRS